MYMYVLPSHALDHVLRCSVTPPSCGTESILPTLAALKQLL